MKLKAGTLGVDISRQTALWLMLLILLICFGLSLPTLNRHQISTDELATLTKIGGIAPAVSPAEIVALVQTHTPDQVPLYYVLVWMWAQFTGFTVFPLRLLSTLTGLLALAAVFRFAAESFDRRVALLSALLFQLQFAGCDALSHHPHVAFGHAAGGNSYMAVLAASAWQGRARSGLAGFCLILRRAVLCAYPESIRHRGALAPIIWFSRNGRGAGWAFWSHGRWGRR